MSSLLDKFASWVNKDEPQSVSLPPFDITTDLLHAGVPKYKYSVASLDRYLSNKKVYYNGGTYNGSALAGMSKFVWWLGVELGVEPIYILSHAVCESAWGWSSIAQRKKNPFGFTAYDTSPMQSATNFLPKSEQWRELCANDCVYCRCLQASMAESNAYSKLTGAECGWINSFTYCILYIKREYLLETGRYWEGNPTLEKMNLHYSTSVDWKYSISRIANSLLKAASV